MSKFYMSETKKIVLAALLTAMFVILDRLITINTQEFQINLSLVAVMIAAILLRT